MTTPPAPYRLLVEQLEAPFGLDEATPRFSWQLRPGKWHQAQAAYRVVVTRLAPGARAGGVVWDSGKVRGAESVLVPYGGKALEAHASYRWTVRVWSAESDAPSRGATGYFATGFRGTAWPKQAAWIGLPLALRAGVAPVRQLRGTFELAAAPVEARLYVAARGVVEPWLNGARVGDEVLAPGWTDYRRRIAVSAFDVTSRLVAGSNSWGAWLGEGWYAGELAFKGDRGIYGRELGLRACIRILDTEGRVSWVTTDEDWRARASATLAASLYHGEEHDARRARAGWCDVRPGAGGGWRAVTRQAGDGGVELAGRISPPIRVVKELTPIGRTKVASGGWIYDLGQNISGVARLRVKAPRGTRVRLRFGEILQADGTLYVANLRRARATDVYVCAGDGVETWAPRFTFHGFRYVEVTGLRGRPLTDAITGVVWSSDLREAGGFMCSDARVNRLQENIGWGQRGNFLDVPTDCPQRDERLGWTGDAQVFAPTALFNAAAGAFWRKYCRDMRDAQREDGAFPDVAPDVLSMITPRRWVGNAAWGDAGVIIPWVVYEQTGDAGILRENFAAMQAWLRYLESHSVAGVCGDTAYGDWVATDAVKEAWAPTPCDLIGTAYFARSAELTARAAEVLGEVVAAREIAALHARVVAAFRREYVTAGARLAGDTQTAYALALAFDLLPDGQRPMAVGHLRRALTRRADHLATGFVGTPLLCPVLSRCGAHDVAVKLLLHEDYPSWLLPVKNGATTMWERWNSWTPEAGFGPVTMNSFNHYAFGAVGEWMYRDLAGLGAAAPGWRALRFTPRPGAGLDAASAWHETPHGRAECGWRRQRGGRVRFEVVVPPNTSAKLVLPNTSEREVSLGPGRHVVVGWE